MSEKFFRFSAGRPEVALAAGLIVLTAALFWPATGFDYVDFDDYLYVPENPIVAPGLRWEGVRQAFTTVHEQWWLPLLWISYMADIAAFGTGASGHHLVNVLLHAANAALLFWVLFRMTGARWRSAFVAALFAWHPTRVEAVAWIAARKDVLSGLFFMLALLAYARHAEKPSGSRWVLVVLALAAGLMAKAILIVLPPILLLLDYWPLRRARAPWRPGGGREWRPLLLEKLPLFALAAGFMAVNLGTHTTGRGAGAPLSLAARLGMPAPNVADYLVKLMVPVRLNVMYPENDAVAWPWAAAAALALAAAVLWLFRQGERRPHLLVGGLWFLVALLPVLRGVRMGLAQFADRWSYLPLIGLGLALAWTAGAETAKPAGRRAASAAGVLVLALCLVLTRAQLPHWQNTLTLFGRAVALAPTGHFARNSLGLALSTAGRGAEAIAHFEEAIRQRPAHGDYHSNLGAALLKLGRAPEALARQDEALRLEPNKAFIHNNRGRALAALGRREEARAAYAEALRLEPAHPEAHYNLGFMFYESGSAADALPHFQAAVAGRPGNATMWFNLGMAHAALGNYAAAEPCVARALELDPDMPNAALALRRIRLLRF